MLYKAMYVKGFVTLNLYNVTVVLKDTIAFLLSIYPSIYRIGPF